MHIFLIKIMSIIMLVTSGLNSADLNIITDRSDFHLKDLVKDFEKSNIKKS